MDKLFQRVWRYRNYWGKKGGITVSGGEPLRQMEFLTAFFELARSKGDVRRGAANDANWIVSTYNTMVSLSETAIRTAR